MTNGKWKIGKLFRSSAHTKPSTAPLGFVMRNRIFSGILTGLLLPSFSIAQSAELSTEIRDRFEVGIQYSVLRLTRGAFIFGPTSVEAVPRQVRSPMGAGTRIVYNLKRSWSFEAEMNVFGEQSVFQEHADFVCCGVGKVMDGRIVEVLAGTKIGHRWRRTGVYLRIRPGVLHFSKTLRDAFRVPGVGFGGNFDKARTDFVTDVGGTLETYVTDKWLVRFDMGDTIQFFSGLNSTLRQQVPFSPDVTRAQTYHNFQIGVGTSFRF